MSLKSVLVLVLLLGAAVASGAWYLAGQEAGPVLQIRQPADAVGRAFTVEVAATAPGGRMSQMEMRIEQGGRKFPIFSLAAPADAVFTQEAPDRVRITRKVAGGSLAGLSDGPARLVVTASRPVLFGLRQAATAAARKIVVRLTPPRVSIVSMHHYVNLGGAEAIVYRVTPADVDSGVQVGDVFYRGFPASGVGITAAPSLRIAFFALLFDQDLKTPMQVIARDPAGNTATVEFDHRVFDKPVVRSRMNVDDGFLARVVPAILAEVPDLKLPDATPEERLSAFLTINGDLRRKNAEQIIAIARETSPEMLWRGPFLRLGRAKTEAPFAEHRTYFYRGREIDRQVHLGFDLASTRGAPVVAANTGHVLFAGPLGIYGNCVIIDHGMGVQSLYAHLSALDVETGDRVDRGEVLGRSGMTGLAGGDHVHFTMLVAGRPVNPLEWWDPHWIEDRVLRKLREAGATL